MLRGWNKNEVHTKRLRILIPYFLILWKKLFHVLLLFGWVGFLLLLILCHAHLNPKWCFYCCQELCQYRWSGSKYKKFISKQHNNNNWRCVMQIPILSFLQQNEILLKVCWSSSSFNWCAFYTLFIAIRKRSPPSIPALQSIHTISNPWNYTLPIHFWKHKTIFLIIIFIV